MEFDDYQNRAQRTDQHPGSEGDPLVIPLLGIVGEAGTLQSEYKKLLRDGAAHDHFHERVLDELGDILWYTANIAYKCGLSLSEIARSNIVKTEGRWRSDRQTEPQFFDEGLAEEEQLPRRFRYTFGYEIDREGVDRVVMRDADGAQLGDGLTDNAFDQDGYRFHDVLHLAHAAMLGWSPVLRRLFHPKRKRRSDPEIDMNEDGGRASVVEETVAAAIFTYAEANNFLQGTERVDWELLRFVKSITKKHEVVVRTEAEWEKAIVTGIRVWNEVRTNDGGTVVGDLYERTLVFEPAS
jgi:NTP pyrophosphatase (non-canonical NTP hydrolase)